MCLYCRIRYDTTFMPKRRSIVKSGYAEITQIDECLSVCSEESKNYLHAINGTTKETFIIYYVRNTLF